MRTGSCLRKSPPCHQEVSLRRATAPGHRKLLGMTLQAGRGQACPSPWRLLPKAWSSRSARGLAPSALGSHGAGWVPGLQAAGGPGGWATCMGVTREPHACPNSHGGRKVTRLLVSPTQRLSFQNQKRTAGAGQLRPGLACASVHPSLNAKHNMAGSGGTGTPASPRPSPPLPKEHC